MSKRLSSGEASQSGPSEYERQAIHAIHAWKNPEIGWLGKAWEAIDWPFSKATAAIQKLPGVQWSIDKGTPPVEWLLKKSVGGLVSLLNDGGAMVCAPERHICGLR
jgi:hypothetical protein